MSSPCDTCPFRKNAKEVGNADWLLEVMDIFINHENKGHTCHKTDPRADLYKAGESRPCSGFSQMRTNIRLNGNVYPETFRTLKDFLCFHGIPNLEQAIASGISTEEVIKALEKMKAMKK